MADFTSKGTSGTATATGTAAVISSSEKQLKQGIWIQVRIGDDDVEVIANDGSTVGILVTSGIDRFFPCDSFNDIKIKGSGTIYYWAF